MKWDIDKALKALELDYIVPGTSFNRVLLDVSLMEEKGLKPTAQEKGRECIRVWSMGIGRLLEAKEFFYARTIREAYLKARRFLKKLNPQELEVLGVQLPKRSNSYMAAKRLKQRRRK